MPVGGTNLTQSPFVNVKPGAPNLYTGAASLFDYVLGQARGATPASPYQVPQEQSAPVDQASKALTGMAGREGAGAKAFGAPSGSGGLFQTLAQIMQAPALRALMLSRPELMGQLLQLLSGLQQQGPSIFGSQEQARIGLDQAKLQRQSARNQAFGSIPIVGPILSGANL